MTLIASILFLLAIWVAVPAPNLWLLPLGIGVPELSPILLIVALFALIASFRGKLKKMAALLSLAAAVLSALPLSKVSRATTAFDRRLAAVFPNAKPDPDMRPSPVVARELFTGLRTGESDVRRAVTFATPEGLPLALDIHKPRGGTRHPVIVQVHGGAWQGGNRTDQETFARYFAGRGYVVITIEYRVAPRWPYPAPLDDVKTALKWVGDSEAMHGGDANNMAVVGRSAGGHLALLAAYTGKTPVRAVVSLYGPTDLTEAWNDPPEPDPASVRGILEAFIGGTPATAPSKYLEASPITWAGAVPPTLQIHGARDHVVPVRFPRELHQRLQAAGTTSLLLEIPWSEHAFDHVPHGLGGQISLYYVERFLSATLAPGR